MKRRNLIVVASGGGFVLVLTGLGRFLTHNPGAEREEVRQGRPLVTEGDFLSEERQLELELAYDDHFSDAAAGRSEETIYSNLLKKGLISSDYSYSPFKLRQAAMDDEIALYRGYEYTISELELYALAVMRHSRWR